MKIVTIDLGKFKSVFLVYLTGGTEQEYGKVETSPQVFHDLLVKHAPDRLVIEAGPAAGWVCDLAESLGIPIQVANTNDERWQRQRKKIAIVAVARRLLMKLWAMLRDNTPWKKPLEQTGLARLEVVMSG